MGLTPAMRDMLLRMFRREWVISPQWPRDGRKRQGWRRTLNALQRRGLVRYLREGEVHLTSGVEATGPGWVLTDEGIEVAAGLVAG